MPRQSKYTKELLEPLVAQTTSMGTLLDSLGLKRTGGNYRNINRHIAHHQISTSHWTGQGWNKGLSKTTDTRVAKYSAKLCLPDSQVFTKNSTYSSGKLLKRLLKLGWKNKCTICDLNSWLEKPIRLHVDHINGICSDHRLENLRILCPNCHQQTDTWGSKSRGR